MRTRHSLNSLNILGLSRAGSPVHACGTGPRPAAAKPAILFVSNDADLAEKLRGATEGASRTVLLANGLAEAIGAVRSGRLAAVLLDLDMPSQGAWKIADGLLLEESCPPMILVTGQREQFDTSTAIRAGALVDKSSGPAKVLEVVDETMALPEANRAERNAVQRIMIQWLRPYAWPVPVTPSYRHWGLNE
jgi:CheY-like chemotaxis protein